MPHRNPQLAFHLSWNVCNINSRHDFHFLLEITVDYLMKDKVCELVFLISNIVDNGAVSNSSSSIVCFMTPIVDIPDCEMRSI